MRHIPITLLALAASAGLASAQATGYTLPVGYVTETLAANQYNLIGLTMQAPYVAQGVLESATSSTVTDSEVDFGALLDPAKKYILEITSGSGAGAIQEISTWFGSELDTPDNISSIVDNTTKYTLRPLATVGSVFGAANSAGLEGSVNYDPEEADIIYIPDILGGFTQVYYVPGDGWLDTNFIPATNLPIPYVDGILIFRRGSTNLDLVVNGEVKKTPTTFVLDGNAFNYLGTVYPVGATLDNSGLASSLTGSANYDPEEADVVYTPDGLGGYIQNYYVPGDGWLDTNFNPTGPTELTSGAIVFRRGGDTNATITPPTNYSAL